MTLDGIKELGFRFATQRRPHHRIGGREDPGQQGRDPRRLRGPGRQGAEPVPEGCDHRRRAAPAAHRDLDRGDRQGQGRHGGHPEEGEVQPDRHDGSLRGSGEHHAGPADRRDAWASGQPQGRHHPAADHLQLPRRPIGAGVLHLHPRRPQGTGRHCPADRRLGVSHPAAGRCQPGDHRAPGRLRHRAHHQGAYWSTPPGVRSATCGAGCLAGCSGPMSPAPRAR